LDCFSEAEFTGPDVGGRRELLEEAVHGPREVEPAGLVVVDEGLAFCCGEAGNSCYFCDDWKVVASKGVVDILCCGRRD
jgi:hypothetical protein